MLFFSRYLHFCVFDDTTQSLSRHPLTETFFQAFDDFDKTVILIKQMILIKQ